MTINFVSSTVSTATEVATACVAAYPASIVAGDGLVVMVGTKPFGATITTPAGYTALGTITNGSTVVGLDTGSVKCAGFFKQAVGTESGTSLTVSIATADSSWAVICRYTKDPTRIWQVATATGTDTTASTSWSVPFSSNPGIANGDYIVLGGVTSTDLAVTWSTFALAATGATIATPTPRQNPRITTGNDLGGNVASTNCTAGTASAVPTWTSILSVATNQAGSAVLVRLREAIPALAVPIPYLVRQAPLRRQARW